MDLKIELPEPIAAEAAAPVSENDSGINWDEFAGVQGADDNGDDITVEGDSVVLNTAPPAEPQTPPTQVPQQEPLPIRTESSPTQAASVPAPVTQTPQTVTLPATVASTVPSPVASVGSAPTLPVVPVQPTLDYGAIEQEQLTQLEKVYGISEEDAQKLQTEPELILPKLAANMHVAITKSAMAALQSMLPQMLVQHQQMATVEQQARNEFFTAHPDLQGHEDAILKVGQMFRAANPTATKEQAVKMIGDMVRMSLGFPLQVQQQQQQPVAAPAPAPSSPSPAQVMPFVPSKAGGAGGQIQSPNMWDQFISDD